MTRIKWESIRNSMTMQGLGIGSIGIFWGSVNEHKKALETSKQPLERIRSFRTMHALGFN